MTKILNVLLPCVLVLPTALWAAPELRGTPEELAAYLAGAPGRVTVIGESELIVPADEMKVSYAIKTEHASLRQALAENGDIRNEITRFLVQQGIPVDRIGSEKFSSTPRQGLFGDRPRSYEVVNRLTIRIRDDAEFAAVAAIADRWKTAYYLSAAAEQTDKEGHKRRAVQQALENAMAKRPAIEQATGVRLRTQQISEGRAVVQSPVFAADRDYEFKKGVGISHLVAEAPVGVDTGPSFGSFTYTATVQVVFVME